MQTAPPGSDSRSIVVSSRGADRYAIGIRGHEVVVDQPDSGDSGPTPTELFVGALASCVAFYAGRFLERHGLARDGLRVEGRWAFADDRPARVARIDLRVGLPEGFPPELIDRLLAVATHCTVHNSITSAPVVAIDAEVNAATMTGVR